MSQTNEMVKLAITALEDKKGEDIRVIDIHEVSVLADYFLIASGSNVHVFDKESRLFYDIERIWRDGKIMEAGEFTEHAV